MDKLEYHFGAFTTVVRFLNKNDAVIFDDKTPDLFIFDQNTRFIFNFSPARPVVLCSGEEHKTRESIEKILKAALNSELDRDSILCGIGGGVVCDISGFAASVYMRGCRLTLVPTTLLAMTDASIGGKTAINFMGYKNIVGTFYPAQEIRICPDILKTLSDAEFRSGLAEVIKHAMLEKSDLFTMLKENSKKLLLRDNDLLLEIIKKSISVKGRIVEEDFKESGIRAHLNLGHTFAHALETVSGFKGWSHGEAVAWGLNKALKTGVALGITDPHYAAEVEQILSMYGYTLFIPGIQAEELIHAMKKDKKRKGMDIMFVLQKNYGETLLRPIEDDLLLSIL